MTNQRLDVFQVEVFSTTGVSRDPALNSPHLVSPLILLCTSLIVLWACFKLFLLNPLPSSKLSGFFRLVPASRPWHLSNSLCREHPLPNIRVPSLALHLWLNSKSLPPRGLLGIPCPMFPPPCHPLVYFLSGVYHDLRVFLIGLANSTEHNLK